MKNDLNYMAWDRSPNLIPNDRSTRIEVLEAIRQEPLTQAGTDRLIILDENEK